MFFAAEIGFEGEGAAPFGAVGVLLGEELFGGGDYEVEVWGVVFWEVHRVVVRLATSVGWAFSGWVMCGLTGVRPHDVVPRSTVVGEGVRHGQRAVAAGHKPSEWKFRGISSVVRADLGHHRRVCLRRNASSSVLPSICLRPDYMSSLTRGLEKALTY